MSTYFDWLQAQPNGKLIQERRGTGGRITEQRTVTGAHQRPRIRNSREFYDYADRLIARQPRTPAGYRARQAALEELCRQADTISYPR